MNKSITKEEIESIEFLSKRGYSVTPNVWYNGDHGLLSSTVDYIRDTDEEGQYQECKKHINYFASKYIKILTPNGFENIKLNSHQEVLLRSSYKYKKSVSISGRQRGITVATLISILHNVIFNHKDTVFYSHNWNSAIQKAEMLIGMISRLPVFLQPGIRNISKNEIEFKSGARIIFKSINTPVYDSIKDVDIYSDDTGHFNETLFDLLLKNITKNENKIGKVIITSTGGGNNYSFYKLHQDAEKGLNNYTAIF